MRVPMHLARTHPYSDAQLYVTDELVVPIHGERVLLRADKFHIDQ